MSEKILDGEAQEYAKDELAFGTPINMVQEELVKRGYEITYHGVYSILRRMPTEELIERRKKLQDRVPIANKWVRMERLEEQYRQAKNPQNRLKILRQAAEEMGDISGGSRIQVNQSQTSNTDKPEQWWQELAAERVKERITQE